MYTSIVHTLLYSICGEQTRAGEKEETGKNFYKCKAGDRAGQLPEISEGQLLEISELTLHS